jgi:hypothetical protein
MNWRRTLEPAVFLAYDNAVTQEGTYSQVPTLLGFRALMRAFRSLAEQSDAASWIHARNWRGEDLRATFDRKQSVFEISGASSARVAPQDVESTIRPLFER